MHHYLKKHLSMFAIAIIAVAGLSSPAFARKGEKTLGLSVGYASYNNSAYTNLSFQYSFSKHVRIAPALGYVFQNDRKSAYTFDIDIHFPFKVATGVKLYPLTGVTFNNWSDKGNGHLNRLGVDAGAGVDLYFTSNLKLSVQGKYSFMKNTSGAFAGVGIGYIF